MPLLDLLENTYHKATGLYKKGLYKDAEELFLSLSLELPIKTEFRIGLASALQMQERWEEALSVWDSVIRIGEEDPSPFYYKAQCFFHLHKKDECLQALLDAEKRSDALSSLGSNIQTLKELLQYGSTSTS